MQRVAVVAVVAILLVGCAAKSNPPTLTAEGSRVREIDTSEGAEVRADCRFLGVVEGDANPSGSSRFTQAMLGGDLPPNNISALNQIRNRVGYLGGDAFILVASDSYWLQAEAYMCGMDLAVDGEG